MMMRYIYAKWLLGVAELSKGIIDVDDVYNAPSIDICFCRECEREWTQKCPPHRMGLIHDENDYCSYGIRKGADDE